MITIPYDQRVRSDPDNAEKPAWGVITLDGKPTLYFMCPCGKRGALFDHDIADDGTVTPSVVHEDCGFHDYIKLEHWPGQDILIPTLVN